MRRPWDVLLVGGAAGTGKTTVGHALARRLGVGITEVDDLHLAIQTMTTPQQQPILHYWRTRPEAMTMSPEQIVDLHVSVARVVAPAVRAVIGQHVESGMPIILEGDYLLPELVLPAEGARGPYRERVRAVFLDEPDSAQIVRNFYDREPADGEQARRALVSRLLGGWLRSECERRDVPVVLARPFDTLADRILAALP